MRALLEKLAGIIEEHKPTRLRHLRPPATLQALQGLEERIGRELPPEFRELYLWRDGQEYELADDSGWQFYDEFLLMPLARIAALHPLLNRQLAQRLDSEATNWLPFLEQPNWSCFCLVLPTHGPWGGWFDWKIIQVYFEVTASQPAGELSYGAIEQAPDLKTWFAAYVRSWESIPAAEWASFEATGDEVFLPPPSIIYHPKPITLGEPPAPKQGV